MFKLSRVIYLFILAVIGIMQAESITLTQSPNDKRVYEALVLPNQLKVIFIQDNEIAKSACSISVGVGSIFDPDRSLGLAHFLEHMLFMGSNKYPEHNQYSAFINANSGFDNAYTSDVETNYYFQVKNSAFNEAVERLTNFFTGALLRQECIEKQSQAVHEEFVLWSNDDNCRKWQVLRKLGQAPYSRFTIGNTDTLRHENIRQDLVNFYDTYYSANIINAVVCSNYSISEMKESLLPFLQAIPNKNLELSQFDLHFKSNQTGKLIRMQSIKDETIMEYFWVVQNLRPFYKKHVSDYISHVIGHEGKNSLLSILKAKKYASQLSAYTHDIKTQTLVGMQVKLTEQGEQHYEQVYNIVMDFMSSLKAEPYIFEEIKERKTIQFQFKEKQKVSEYVCHLSSKMHNIPLPEILNYSAIFDDYDGDLINRVLNQLNPFNVIILFSSFEELEDPIKEKYLGAKYRIEDLPKRNKSGLNFEPMPPNIYIPINTQLFNEPTEFPVIPTKIGENVYFLHDSSFRVCRGGIELRVYSEQPALFIEFYSSYLNLLLKEVTYPAESLQCKIEYDNDDCLIITIFGFTDTVMKMLSNIAEQIHRVHDQSQSKGLFQVALHDFIENYENFYNEESDQVANGTLDILMNKGVETIEESLLELENYQYESITEKTKHFWNHNKLKWVVVGNFEKNRVASLIQKVESKLKGGSTQPKIFESGCLKLTDSLIHDVFLQSQELSSSCSIVYFQAGPYSQELYYKLLLLKNYIDEPYFNQLRTQKQMAYYLAVRIQNIRGILGMKFILVSSTRDPKNISDEIKSFVFSFFEKMGQDLTAENQSKFSTIKESVFTKIKTPHNNLEGLFEFVAQQISQKTYFFERKQEQQIHRYLDPITVNNLKQTWQGMRNQTLQLHVVSKSHEKEYEKYKINAESIEDIKQKCVYWNDLFQCE